MKTKTKIIALSFALASADVMAGSAIEARGDAMGGVGVVASNYLTAPFYNPAVGAVYRENDTTGVLLPSIGVSYDDQDNMIDNISNLADSMESDDISEDALNQLSSDLDKLDDSQFNAEIGFAAAVAIPNAYLSLNLFGRAYVDTFIASDVGTCSASDDEECLEEKLDGTTLSATSVGITEVGLSMAHYTSVFGQHMTIGISPKLQRIYTFVYQTDLENFDLSNVGKNVSSGENVLNVDVGALWFYGPFRLGVAGMNMVSHDIKTKVITGADSSDVQYHYKMRPQYTVGAGIVANYFSLSVDYDLNEQERFEEFDDNVQMLRIGAELDLLHQIKLRAGVKKNLAYDGSDLTYTAGIGLSPLNLFEMDIAADYTNKNAMGAYVNFLGDY